MEKFTKSTTVIYLFPFRDTKWNGIRDYMVVIVKFDSGIDDVRPGIDLIETIQGHFHKHQNSEIPKKEQLRPL